MASSTLVNVAEHAELRLVHALTEISPEDLGKTSFKADCQQCIGNADAPNLIRTIVGNSAAMKALFSLKLDEAVSAFSLLAAILSRVRVDNPSLEETLAEELAEVVVVTSQQPQKQPSASSTSSTTLDQEESKKRLTMLCALYNLRVGNKCQLLTRIVKVAAATDPSLLAEDAPLGKLLDQPDLHAQSSKMERRQLYRAASDSIPDSISRKHRFLLKLLSLYEDESEVDDGGLGAAKEATIAAIRDPVTLNSEQRSMLTKPAIQALEKSSGTEKLFQLLKIFHHGMLTDYQEFISKNPSVVKDYGLSPEECMKNMRLLSLCSLASQHEEIPYSVIASTLQVDAEEVESWVIQGVSSGLISAKMDQLSQVVMVERCAVRQFGTEQWKSIQSRLHHWKRNVKNLLQVLEHSQSISHQQHQPGK